MADFRREYGITSGELARMSTREFSLLLRGLSPSARWMRWAGEQPVELSGQAEVSRALRDL